MHCIVIGRSVWLFSAPNKREGRRRANQILSLETLKSIVGNRLSYFGPDGAWEATKESLSEQDIRRMLEVAPKGTIVEIKRVRPIKLDAIYMTRRQKEREAKV